MGYHCFTTQIIGKDGVLDIPRLDNFTNDVKLNDPYAVVSIVGAQSSGKSTLMNHLFGTDFQEMNTNGRRSQTTNGIWLAKAKNIEPCTLVMDLEGTDGKERGVDDTSFEKQSALFALAVSDVILINMWCHDIGREHAGNRPLLKTVFQVLMRLFDPHKKTMLFVIRDKTKTPFENIVADLREDVQQIWDGVRKPQSHTDAPLSDFFNIQIEGLSNYEENPELFKDQVCTLRNWFRKSIGRAGPSGNQHGVVPASGFSYSTNEIWKCIKEDEDLNLPKHKEMVATVRCGQISSEKVANFTADQEWKHLKETVQNDYVPGFGKKISTLLHRCLSEYDMECIYYDDGVKTSKRQQLESEILQLVYPAYISLMKHLLNGTLKEFKESFHEAQKIQEFRVAARACAQSFLHKFKKGCEDATIQQKKWDPATFENELKHAIDAHVESVRVLKRKVADLCGRSEGRLTIALAKPVEEVLRSAPYNTWANIKMLLENETITACEDLKCALLDLELDEGTVKESLSRLEKHGRIAVELKTKEEAATISIRMKDRFKILFNADMSRARNRKEYIQAIADECMMMLWIISAIQLDGDGDTFENFRSLLDEGARTTDKSYQFDPLASISRKKVLIPKAGTLISPDNCKLLWSQFMFEVDYIVTVVLNAEGRLTRALAEPVKEFLSTARYNTWAAIKMLLVNETLAAAADLKYCLLDLELDEGRVKELISRLKNHGRSVVESKAEEEAATISIRMKDRFKILFNADMSREQKGKIDVQAIAESALDECMMMLWIISAIRLDGDGDTFENFHSLLDIGSVSSISWKKILKEGTLISPDGCKLLWFQFMVEVDPIVTAALDSEESYKWKKRIRVIQITLLALRLATSTVIFATTGIPTFF